MEDSNFPKLPVYQVMSETWHTEAEGGDCNTAQSLMPDCAAILSMSCATVITPGSMDIDRSCGLGLKC